MSNRRTFMEQCVKGAAGFAVSGLVSSRRILGANDRIRFGLIGCGSRGKEILRSAMHCDNAEAVAAADVYTRRLEEAKAMAPRIKTYKDARALLDDQSVDAVLIATPQHQHALNFIPAIQAGKDVYQEKTMAFSPDHAKRMRKALVVGQIAITVVLTLAGGLFVRGLSAAQRAELGFLPERVLNVQMDVGQVGYSESRGRAFFDDVAARIRELPGVEQTAYAFSVPFGYVTLRSPVNVENQRLAPPRFDGRTIKCGDARERASVGFRRCRLWRARRRHWKGCGKITPWTCGTHY